MSAEIRQGNNAVFCKKKHESVWNTILQTIFMFVTVRFQ